MNTSDKIISSNPFPKGREVVHESDLRLHPLAVFRTTVGRARSAFRMGFGFLFLLLLSGCLQPQKSDEERERDRLIRNKIKSITEYKTYFTSNMAAKEQPSHLKIFNAKGFVVKEIDYNDSGTAEQIFTCEYDQNDNLTCTTIKNSDSSLLGKETRSYDEKNNLKELIYSLSDGTIEHKYTYLYDDAGKMREMNVYWPPAVLSAVHTYIYDGKKKLEDAEYSAERKLLGKWNYKYDLHGNLLEAIRSDADSGKNKKITYLYNTINQVIRQAAYSGEALQNTLSFEYNKKYFISVKNEFSSAGKITAKYRYQYEFL